METLQLLKLCWGGLGDYSGVLAVRRDRWHHHFVRDYATARQVIEGNRDADIFFTPAVFEPEANRRVGDQVYGVGAFWLDIDCGPGKDYASPKAGGQALAEFCRQVNLPLPTLVYSGAGLHGYWILDDFLDPDEWRARARGLKAAARELGFHADPARTADVASVLRVPGTLNYKYDPPRKVKLLYHEGVHDASLFDRFEVRQPATEWDVPRDFPPISARRIAERCAVVGRLRDTRGNVSEPLWYSGLQLLRHTLEAPGICHEWSEGHPEYSEAETDYKLQRLEAGGIGPTLCDRFAEYCPELCAACPHRGKIKSPAQLGVVSQEPEEAAPVVGEEVDETPWAPLPDLIKRRYAVTAQGVWALGGDDEDDVQLFDHPVWVRSIGQAWTLDAIVEVAWITPAGTLRTRELSLKLLADQKGFEEWWYTHAVFPVAGRKRIMRYIQDWAKALTLEKDPDDIIVRFGWLEDRFIWWDRQVSHDGVTVAKMSSGVPSRIRNTPWQAGDASVWLEALKVLERPGYEPYAFAVLASLASPILNLMGVSGAALSLSGPSGYGKTVSTRFALSAFSHPDLWTLSPQGTMNAKGEYFRLANNLPLAIDDITTRQHREISELIYMAVNGRAKERMNRSGTVRDTEEWALALLITTNSPLMDLDEKAFGEAERRRVLEFYVQKPLARQDAAVLVNAATKHYGTVAEKYLQALAKNREALGKAAQDLADVFFQQYEIPDQNRFGVWLIAAAALGAQILCAVHGLRFRYQHVIDYALKQLKTLSKEVKIVDTESMEELISDYLLQHHGQVAVHAGGRGGWITGMNIRGPVAAKIDKSKRLLYIPVRVFKDYVQGQGRAWRAVLQWAKETPQVELKAAYVAPNSPIVRCIVWKVPREFIESLASEIEEADR